MSQYSLDKIKQTEDSIDIMVKVPKKDVIDALKMLAAAKRKLERLL
jgi:hypothetical protein